MYDAIIVSIEHRNWLILAVKYIKKYLLHAPQQTDLNYEFYWHLNFLGHKSQTWLLL